MNRTTAGGLTVCITPGIDCELTGLVGIYTNPNHVLEYTSDGEVRQEFSIVFTARAVSGEPTPSSEFSQVVWVSPDNSRPA